MHWPQGTQWRARTLGEDEHWYSGLKASDDFPDDFGAPERASRTLNISARAGNRANGREAEQAGLYDCRELGLGGNNRGDVDERWVIGDQDIRAGWLYKSRITRAVDYRLGDAHEPVENAPALGENAAASIGFGIGGGEQPAKGKRHIRNERRSREEEEECHSRKQDAPYAARKATHRPSLASEMKCCCMVATERQARYGDSIGASDRSFESSEVLLPSARYIAMPDASPQPPTIVAWGMINALGNSSDSIWERLLGGPTGLVQPAVELPFQTTAGACATELPPLPKAQQVHDSRCARLLAAAYPSVASTAAAFVRRYGAESLGIVVGTSTGGMLEAESALAMHARDQAFPPHFDLHRTHAFGALVEVLRGLSGARGPGWIVSSACASSAKALASAQRILNLGIARAVLVAGVDSLCQTTLRGFQSLSLLSPTPCRPFAADRDGTSIGEGAAIAFLQSAAEGPAILAGVGESSDAHHMSQPEPLGRGAQAAMRAALERAHLSPREIDYINAHGTATVANDSSEAAAISAVFGPLVPISSTKGATGHLLGAAGLTEALICLEAIIRGVVLPNRATPTDASFGLALPTVAMRRQIRRAMSNSFAFGGSNASVVLEATR